MNLDPASLDRLHGLVVPPPVPWWPPAPGWCWALGALSILLAAGAVRTFIRWQRNRYRREAIAEWRRCTAHLADADRRGAALAELAVLLKRTALSGFPRAEVAFLTGSAWFVFLSRTSACKFRAAHTSELLERVAYGEVSAPGLDERKTREAAKFVRRWIVHHRVGGKGYAR